MAKKMKASGGGVKDDDKSPKDVYAGKDSNVVKEADDKEERKNGGKVAFKRGGAVKHLGKIDGHRSEGRLDKPGRKRGGGVGSDRMPLSSAARYTDADERQKPE